MIVGVLANDNPQGLLLAARLLGHARIRVSVGGRLGKLLDDGWRLLAENLKGEVKEVKIRVLKRGDNSTKEEEDRHWQDVLWICDWKDPAVGWYSLSDCDLILQTSKATDSKTVAMWLVEVCKEDAMVVSLQSGLHNARELRTVFGHPGGSAAGQVVENMPLVATQTGRKATGSIDTNDGVLSRRESVSSIYSEISGLEGAGDESFDATERSASPMPPGLAGVNLPSPTSSDSGSKGGRTSAISFKEELEASLLSERNKLNASGNAGSAKEHMGSGAQEDTASQDGGINPNMKKPNVILIAGVLGFGASAVVDETHKTLTSAATHHGAIVVERCTRKNTNRALSRLLLLERSGWKVMYKQHEETNNWLWGDVVWRSFESYGAALRVSRPDTYKSLYALLTEENATHRRVYAGLIDEALSALRWQKVELMDHASSPFGLSFRAARSLLLLPQPVFAIALKLVLRMRFPLQCGVKEDSPYCDSVTVQKYMAPFINGEVVRMGFEAEVQTPLNQEVIELLSQVLKQQQQSGGSTTSTSSASTSSSSTTHSKNSSLNDLVKIKQASLPELYSMSFFICVASLLVLLLSITIRFTLFVLEVTFYW